MNDTQLQKIRKWFYNNSDMPQHQYINFTRSWSAQNAFFHQNCRKLRNLCRSSRVLGYSSERDYQAME